MIMKTYKKGVIARLSQHHGSARDSVNASGGGNRK
jgi:hypothetical protein